MVRSLFAVSLLLLLSACAGGHRGGPHAGARWDGRRGYDGRGDYGYDLDAPRAEAAAYRASARRSYPVPGPPEDPGGPYIREAAARHAVPERWIREVMRQESGGRSDATSPVGAMGLMQVMPGTYDALRRRHGWATTPTSRATTSWPGAAYLREMHDRFGAPAFLAAYNAGPERVDAVLAGATVLPTRRWATWRGWRRASGWRRSCRSPPPPTAGSVPARTRARMSAGPPPPSDPTDRAFDGGGLVTPWAPTGDRTGRGAGSGT
jgi:hypothetical protein